MLLVNKPAGMTSHDVVAILRKKLNQKDIGHTGTLDPMATGLMVTVLGEATKLSDYLTADDKSYRLNVQLGLKTDTLDVTGTTLETCEVDLPKEKIESAVHEQIGEFLWPIPIFSAAKVDGQRLYEKGRRGESFETPMKPMKFWQAEIEEVLPASVRLSVFCSKGSFIRTWASQLGDRLGVGGCLKELTRLTVGSWSLKNAIELEAVSQAVAEGSGGAFVPMQEALPFMRAYFIEGRDQRLLMNGQVPKDLAARLIFEQKESIRLQEPITVKVLDSQRNMLALLAAVPGQGVKIRRIFKS